MRHFHWAWLRNGTGLSCTGLHCRRPECRKRRKERLRKAWEERESRRPSLAEREEHRLKELNALFKEVFRDEPLNRYPYLIDRFMKPEERQAIWLQREAERERKWSSLPKIILQDDRWRLEVEARAQDANRRAVVAFGRDMARKLFQRYGCVL